MQIRHGELRINLSQLRSLFRQQTSTVFLFWSVFLRLTDNSAWNVRWKHGVQNSLVTSPKVYISTITASSVTAQMSQIWQVIIYNGRGRAKDRTLAQFPSFTSVCAFLIAQISKSMLVLALSLYMAYISSHSLTACYELFPNTSLTSVLSCLRLLELKINDCVCLKA